MKRNSDIQSWQFYYVDVDLLERNGIRRYSPKEGENVLSIIPPPDEVCFFAKKVHVHRDIGVNNRTFLCLRQMYQKPCPVCEKMLKLKREYLHDDRFKLLIPKIRFLYYVVDITSPSSAIKGVRWFDAPEVFKLETMKLSKCADGSYIDISDPDDGKDVSFVRSGKGKDTRYDDFQLLDRDPIHRAWLEDVLDFDDVLCAHDYEKISSELG
jgi:hypothetical protein